MCPVGSVHSQILEISVGKNGSWDFVELYCFYILKSQRMREGTYLNVMNMKAVTDCACLKWLHAMLLGTTIISCAGRVGLSL